MLGSFLFGGMLGAGYMVFARVLPQPAGSIVWFAALTVLLGRTTIVCWRRTRLPLTSSALALATTALGLMTSLALAGHVYPDWPLVWWIAYGALAIATYVCILLDVRFHPAEMAHWRRHMQGMSVWDLLLGRHIPKLAGDDRSHKMRQP